MPLRVHCPNGCLIRLPNSRSGKVVRCSECKATLRLPPISESEAQSGKPIPITALLIAQPQSNVDVETPPEDIADQTPTENSNPEHVADLSESIAPEKSNADREAVFQEPATATVPQTKESAPVTINLPVESKPEPLQEQEFVEINLQAGSTGTQKRNVVSNDKKKTVDSLESVATQIESVSISDPVIKTDIGSSIDSGKDVSIELNRSNNPLSQRKKDFKTIARFYGVCVGFLGLVSLIPAIIMLVRIQQQDFTAVTPRWIYLMMFVGALHLVYAVYLIQIADWSALWAVSILMLVASCVYGMFSAAIMLDSGFGPIAEFLQLAGTQTRTAGTGCLVGLLFSVLTAYLCGREALNWKRTEQKLLKIAIHRQQQSPQPF